MLINPHRLFAPAQVSALLPLAPPQPASPARPAFQPDTLQLQARPTAAFPADDHDEALPLDMIKESLVTKLLFALKSPLQLFSSDPQQIVATGRQDAHGNPIRLTREAAAGFEKILTLAASRGIEVKVTSSYRTVEKQAFLWERGLKKYGSASAARKWVAPPGKSRHNFGKAIDMHMVRQGKKVSQAEFDEIIAAAGMYRPMAWEGWHIEPLSTRQERKGSSHHDH